MQSYWSWYSYLRGSGAIGWCSFKSLKAPKYREKSEDNRIRFVEMPAPRGVIRDRHGYLSSATGQATRATACPAISFVTALLLSILVLPSHVTHKIRDVQLRPYRNAFRPQRLRRDLPYPLLARFEETRDRIPGAYLEIEPKRLLPETSPRTRSVMSRKFLTTN